MQKISKLLIGVGILAGIVLAGLFVGWLGSRMSGPNGSPAHTTGESSVLTNAASPTPVRRIDTTSLSNSAGLPDGMVTASSETNLMTDWEDKVDQILGSDTDDTNKVKQLFAIFPALPEDGKGEVAQHLSNLLSDEEYAPLGKLLKDAKLPESVLDTLMADVLNRPNSVKLPMFLDLASTPDHPKAEESKDLLELYLDEDFGTDWDKWRQKMQEWLKDNPD